ncbi:MAG TPA: FAD:protein FMN transferase [Candidatus Dormibacteraeota bacterium]|nr:FAD:protein FMN transferase [Candidatus Dormibacteraeota bacterium]
MLHHIVDPATGLPRGRPMATATVAAASCVDANIAATAAIVMAERALPWLERQGLAARSVDQSGAEVCTSSWPG